MCEFGKLLRFVKSNLRVLSSDLGMYSCLVRA